MGQPKENYAFISYKREDEKWAKWLQDKLEHYKFPTNLNGRTDLPKHIRPTFRDVTDLKPGLLAEEINHALLNSEWLVVVCSPRSAKSPWVCKEAQTFIDLGRADHIIPFVVEGTPFSNDPAAECYPESLLNLTGSQELLAANINEMGRDAATIKVVARMFNLRFDALWQRFEREQRRKRWMWIGVIAAIVCCSIGVAAWMYHKNWEMMRLQSRFIAEKASSVIDEGDYSLAQLLALEILPENIDFPSRPYVPEAEILLRQANRSNSTILHGHTGSVFSAAYAPNGKYIVSSSSDNTIRLWDENGNCLVVFSGHEGTVFSVKFSPDGKQIVSSSLDKTIRLWDVASGKPLKILKGHNNYVYSVSWSPDGKYIASASLDKTIRLWNAISGRCIRIIRGHEESVSSVVFSPNSKFLASASFDNTIRIWDVANGDCKITLKHTNGYAVEFSPDSQSILGVDEEENVCIWDITTGDILVRIPEASNVMYSTAYSPDGKKIACSLDYTIRVWDLESKKCLNTLVGHSGNIRSVSFSLDGEQLLSASWDKTVRIWDLQPERFGKTIIYSQSSIPVSYSHHGRYILYAKDDYSICICDTIGTQEMTLLGHQDRVRHAVFSIDDEMIASASQDSTIRIWNVGNGRCLHMIKVHGWINHLSFSPNGNILLAACGPTLLVIDVQTGEQIKMISGDDSFDFVSYSPDGKKVVTVHPSNTIRVWDIESFECVIELKGHTDWGVTAFFSPNGKSIVTTALDHTVKVWDVSTGECIKEMETEEGNHYACFNGNGELIAYASGNKIYVEDLKRNECVAILKGHQNNVRSMAFSSNGKELLSSSADGTIKVWELPPLQELIDQTRKRLKNRKLTTEERRKYYLE